MRVFGQLKSAQIEYISSDPASAAQTGRLYFNTTTGQAKITNGTIWKNIAYNGGTAANDHHLKLASAATGTLTALTRDAGAVYYDTSTSTVKYDDGSNLIEFATATGQFSLSDGLVATPSLKFISETSTGLYRVSAGNFGFTVLGTQRLLLSASGATVTGDIVGTGISKLADGAAGAPAYSFSSDPDTGMYRSGSNTLAFALGGVDKLILSTSLVSEVRIRIPDGSATVPSFSFSSDTDTGVYLSSTGVIAFTTAGVQRLLIGTTVMRSFHELEIVDGTAASPAFRFTSDTDTGFYRSGTNQIGFASAGSQIAELDSTGLAVGSLASTDHLNWKVFTGTLAASTEVTLTNPGTILLGVVGVATLNGGTVYNQAMRDVPADTTIGTVGFDTGASNPDINVRNYDTDDSNSYRVVMFYR